jgi:hypothetical protein
MTTPPPEDRKPASEQSEAPPTPELPLPTREQVTEALLKVIAPPDRKH